MTPELKPCPRCGAAAKYDHYLPDTSVRVQGTCDCVYRPFFPDIEAAAEWWNTRHVPEAWKAAIEALKLAQGNIDSDRFTYTRGTIDAALAAVKRETQDAS